LIKHRSYLNTITGRVAMAVRPAGDGLTATPVEKIPAWT